MKNRDFTNVGARGRKVVVHEKKIDGVWKVLVKGNYVGSYPTRKDARNAKRTLPSGETISSTTQEASCNPTPVAVSSEVNSESSTPVSEEKKIMRITLTKRNTNKGGGTLYTLAGLGGSVRFPKSLFAEGQEPPASVTIEAPDGTLALPGSVKVKVTSEEQAAKIRANAEKAQARADKAAARAAKAQAKLASLAATSASASPAGV